MSSLLIIILSIVLFYLAYLTYAKKIEKLLGADSSLITPALEQEDGRDYVPSNKYVLLGHHFASIAGIATIVGPIQAAVFGWLPVLLWIVFAVIFFGGVLDYGSLMISLKHGGESLGGIVEKYTGSLGKFIFNSFAWLTLLLLMASFIDIISNTFYHSPQSATASILFIIVSFVFGISLYRKKISLILSSIIAIVFLFGSIWISESLLFNLNKNQWTIFLSVYIFIASVTPIWLVLQPRDYLNSYLLYFLIAGSILAMILISPEIRMESFTSLKVGSEYNGKEVFPTLFLTVASGAVCGYHSFISSGSSAKQIKNEGQAKLIGYGSMILEGLLAIIALMIAAQLSTEQYTVLLNHKGPLEIFTRGVGYLFSELGLDFEKANGFLILVLASLSLTSLDTLARLAGKILSDLLESEGRNKGSKLKNIDYFSYGFTIILSCLLALGSYKRLWIIFGIANHLLSVLVLFTICIWLKRTRRKYFYFSIPLFFILSITFIAIFQELYKFFLLKDGLLVVILLLLLGLSSLVVYQSLQIFIFNKVYRE